MCIPDLQVYQGFRLTRVQDHKRRDKNNNDSTLRRIVSSDEDSRTVVIRSAGGKELSIEEDVSPESEEKTGTKIINLYVILTAVAGAVIALGRLGTGF